MKKAYKILVRKPEGREHLEKPKCRWEDTRLDLKEVGWEGVDLMHLAKVRGQWQSRLDFWIQ
jgi:hypothetical protein